MVKWVVFGTPPPPIRKSVWDNRFETGSFLAKMSSFWDPQSGNPYGIIDLKMVHFWLKWVVFGTPIPKSLWDNRFQNGLFLVKMSGFWDPQSGNPYGIIDLKLVHFWSKTAKTWSLPQNTDKHMHDPPAVAQAESSPNLLQTDNYFWNAVQRKWRFAQ